MELIDTHCHLDDEQLVLLRRDVLSRAREAGLVAILSVGTELADSIRCAQLAAAEELVFAAVGIHPNECGDAQPDDWDRIIALLEQPKIVALGETGLDRYWDRVPFPKQQDYFARHLELSRQRDLPVVIHMRDCDAEMLESLRHAHARGPLRGVMHSFTGTEATARECLEMGLYISFAGMVTYRKSEALRQIASTIPDDRILVETDAPYLSPHPVRGRRPNEPAMVVHTAACLAELRSVTLEQFARQATENARRLFRL